MTCFLLWYIRSLSGSGVPSAVDKEWEEVEREREARKREMERARQELETRKRIEARLRAKQEVEGKARRESTENSKFQTLFDSTPVIFT